MNIIYSKRTRTFFLSILFLFITATTYSSDDVSLASLLNLDVTIATKLKQSVNDAPSIVSVITENEIKNSGAKTIEEILKQVAGFDINPIPIEPNPQVGIRGLANSTNEIVKLMINGHPIENTYTTGFGYWEGFPIDLIKKIEIIRGPGSALYGNSAMIGVINVITKDSKDDSALSAGYGSFDSLKGYANMAYNDGKFGLFLFADGFKSNGDSNLVESDFALQKFGPVAAMYGLDPKIVGDAPGMTTENFEYYNFYSKMSYNNLYVVLMGNKAVTDIPVSLRKTLTDDNTRKLSNAFIEGGFSNKLSEKANLNMKAYADYFKYDYNVEILSEKTTGFLSKALGLGYPLGESAKGHPVLENYKIGTEASLSYSILEGFDLVSGIQYEQHEQFGSHISVNFNGSEKPTMLNGSLAMPLQYFPYQDVTSTHNFTQDEDRNIIALYGQFTFDIIDTFSLKGIGETLSITGGVRYDKYSDIGSNINPRAGLVYAPNELLYFKALYGKAFRAPNFRELYNKNNDVQNGNPDCEAEVLTTVEGLIGINPTKWMTLSVDYFVTKMEDMISIVPDPDHADLITFDNVGTVKSSGVEGEIKLSLDKNKYGYFNITYQDVKTITHEKVFNMTGKPTQYSQPDYNPGSIPEFIANFGINTDITKYMNFNVCLNYIGERKRSEKLVLNAQGDLEKIDKRNPIAERYLVNASLMFKDFDFAEGMSFQITAYNLLNEDDRAPDPEGDIANDVPRWGRNFLARLTYEF
ncbi:MAG: TonB-dependent receptor [Desulfobacterales bacterium]|nr:TonB-dependent receptor [Desulfobacterales bacterium]